jgi:hypothetical protein
MIYWSISCLKASQWISLKGPILIHQNQDRLCGVGVGVGVIVGRFVSLRDVPAGRVGVDDARFL